MDLREVEEFTQKRNVTGLYRATATVTEEDLESVVSAGISIGHYGFIECAYLEINTRALAAKNLDEKGQKKFRRAFYTGNLIGYLGEFQRRGIDSQEPSREVLLRALRESVVDRGVTVEDRDTSTGSLYQKLFGQNFPNYSLISLRDNNGEQVPYEFLPRRIQIQAEKQFIQKIVDDDLRGISVERLLVNPMAKVSPYAPVDYSDGNW